MKQVAMERAAPFLPQEIITNILKLLPVKSLIRFQVVCKHWNKLIKSPSFIAAHLHRSTQHRPCLLLQSQYANRSLYLLDADMQIVQVHNVPEVDDGMSKIVGSDNGLICLRVDFFRRHSKLPTPPSFLLWNPTFNEIRQVPTTQLVFDGYSYVGFGFSPIVNDYKIMMVYVYVFGYAYKIHLVEVYSLRIGSWKKIEARNLEGLILMGPNGFTMDGAIFWLATKKDTMEGVGFVIVSFDIEKEVFALIPVPSINLGCGFHLTEFNQRLAILCSIPNGNSKCVIDLWVSEENTNGTAERWNWSKKYSSRCHSCFLNPQTIWRNRIACIAQPMHGADSKQFAMTVLSNFSNAKLEVLSNHAYFAFNYVQSLVPVCNIHVKESEHPCYVNDALIAALLQAL